jgi:predicted AlkP superfamily pyrophosphatase or phosphodiesterase
MDSRLLAAFDSGALIRPDSRRLNLVDLVNALALLTGVENSQSPGARRLADQIGPAEHIIFILVDGLGMNLVRRMGSASFIHSRLKSELLSLFPSTTAAALTTVATGKWPSEHGVTGWWTHLPEFGVTATILPFVDRFAHRSLSDIGLNADKVFPCHALHPKMKHHPLSMLPAKLPSSIYSVYSRGGTDGSGYWAIDAALEQVIERIGKSRGPTYTYVYIPDVDTLGHFRGWDHEDVVALAGWIDHQIAKLADALAGKARIIISADHGQTKVPLRDRLALYDGDALLELLKVPPSGNPVTPMFHVREGREKEFADLFNQRYASHFSLVSDDDADELELLGPGKMSDVTRRRVGDFIGIPRIPATLKYYERGKIPASDDLGTHSGLTPHEMWIPLAVAG